MLQLYILVFRECWSSILFSKFRKCWSISKRTLRVQSKYRVVFKTQRGGPVRRPAKGEFDLPLVPSSQCTRPPLYPLPGKPVPAPAASHKRAWHAPARLLAEARFSNPFRFHLDRSSRFFLHTATTLHPLHPSNPANQISASIDSDRPFQPPTFGSPDPPTY